MIIDGKVYGEEKYHNDQFIKRTGVGTKDLYEIFDDTFLNFIKRWKEYMCSMEKMVKFFIVVKQEEWKSASANICKRQIVPTSMEAGTIWRLR